MAILSTEQTYVALRSDLTSAGAKGFTDVVNDVARKTFTARNDGAIYEFAHKQPDTAYWTGVKYYGSGKQSRIRFRRTLPEVAPPKAAKTAKAPRVPKAAKLVAVGV